MNPICMKCNREMQCKENEISVKDAAVGNMPSTVWYGDLFACPDCGAEVATGFGAGIATTNEATLEKAVLFKE